MWSATTAKLQEEVAVVSSKEKPFIHNSDNKEG
jgi:hypothetical protein